MSGLEFLAICGKIREVNGASAARVPLIRAVAQLGRAPGSGPGGRGFKSHQPDLVFENPKHEYRISKQIQSNENSETKQQRY